MSLQACTLLLALDFGIYISKRKEKGIMRLKENYSPIAYLSHKPSHRGRYGM
jgi:hypothetical protein